MPVNDFTTQLKNDNLQHLLTLQNLSLPWIERILDHASGFLDPITHRILKRPTLQNKIVFNLFFEPSTRTRTTFEIAAKHLWADVINFNIEASSQSKGETIRDMVANLSAMHGDLIVIRHRENGMPHFIAQHVSPSVHVINAGDGAHQHPTQGLLDLYTIRHFKKEFRGLRVAIVGDILHSRVARSLIDGLTTLGVKEIHVAGPKGLMPSDIGGWPVNAHTELSEAIDGVDVIVMLRIQQERMETGLIDSMESYRDSYCLTEARLKLANPDVIVMHPGPINREVEITSAVADGAQSVILKQVTFGIAVRMAIMDILVNGVK